MGSSVSLKDQIWFLRVCHHVSNVLYQAAEDKPNSLNVDTGPGYLSSMFVCGAAQWVKLRESWAQFEIFDFVRCLKIYLGAKERSEGKENIRFIITGVDKFSVQANEQTVVSSSGLEMYFVHERW